MPLSKAMAYADDCLRFTLEYGGGNSQWLLKRDLETRAKMATLIRRDYPPVEALREATREMHADWHSNSLTPRQGRKRTAPPDGDSDDEGVPTSRSTRFTSEDEEEQQQEQGRIQ